jgi:hypothetical protein
VSSGVPGFIGKEHAGEERREVCFFLEGQDEVESIPGGTEFCGIEFIDPVTGIRKKGKLAEGSRRLKEMEVDRVVRGGRGEEKGGVGDR